MSKKRKKTSLLQNKVCLNGRLVMQAMVSMEPHKDQVRSKSAMKKGLNPL